MERPLAVIAIVLGALAIAIVTWSIVTASTWRSFGALTGFIGAVLAINFAQAANTKKHSQTKK